MATARTPHEHVHMTTLCDYIILRRNMLCKIKVHDSIKYKPWQNREAG
jgi:hypothetical protein